MPVRKSDILYLGDTSLDGAAGYLAGLMSLWKLSFDYVPSDRPADSVISLPHRLFILSDYSSKLLPPSTQQAIVDAVGAGAGLLMIGGWESFCGHGGDWAGTIIAGALPVQISATDDRVNCDQPALLRSLAGHPITDGLPWDRRPPTVGGFNQLIAKPSASVLLEVERFDAQRATDDSITFKCKSRHPMLVVTQHGAGRTAALATDVAPHWVGGLVDWGEARVTAHAPRSWSIEVGNLYAKFLQQLLYWTGSL